MTRSPPRIFPWEFTATSRAEPAQTAGRIARSFAFAPDDHDDLLDLVGLALIQRAKSSWARMLRRRPKGSRT